MASKFTSHYVSINSLKAKISELTQKNLHPTMYLLIRYIQPGFTCVSRFTSHYVSINSQEFLDVMNDFDHLHPTMYLLIPCQTYVCNNLKYNLHPTMYLLIHPGVCYHQSWQADLHPTMYLLILVVFGIYLHIRYIFTSHYVSINSSGFIQIVFNIIKFTSHYVSINSKNICCKRGSIHIYIPLCIY